MIYFIKKLFQNNFLKKWNKIKKFKREIINVIKEDFKE